jgi:hypothetical protein
MNFGSWLPLAQLQKEQVPTGPGLYQLRVATGLIPYPTGKSAMVAYGGGEDVADTLQLFLASEKGAYAKSLGELLVRFAVPPPTAADAPSIDYSEQLSQQLLRLQQRFVEQFGTLPIAQTAVSPP